MHLILTLYPLADLASLMVRLTDIKCIFIANCYETFWLIIGQAIQSLYTSKLNATFTGLTQELSETLIPLCPQDLRKNSLKLLFLCVLRTYARTL